MILDEVLERFVAHSPITVMAQLGLERVLDPAWMEVLFEEHRGRQYERELLFSTTVDVVALVALGMRPAVHAAALARQDLGVSLSALCDKLNRTDPALGRALVQQSAVRLAPVVEQFRSGQKPVDCHGQDGSSIRLRRIELHLHKATEDGDTVIRILSNLPERVSAMEIADLYRRRWTIESNGSPCAISPSGTTASYCVAWRLMSVRPRYEKA